MKNKNIITIIIFLLISSMVFGQEDLNRYLETAAENNPELQAKFNEYMAALEVIPQAKALPDPQIAFAYFVSPVETRMGPQEFKISASQFFPWFGTLGAKEDAAIQMAKSKYEVFEETKSRIFKDVKAEYYNLYFNQKSIDIVLENIELLKTIQNMATIKIEAGVVSMVDEYRVQMEINDLENQLSNLKDKQWALETSFRNLLNAEGDLTIHLPDDLWRTDFPVTKQTALDSIQSKNHQLLQIEFKQAALAYQKEAARKEGMPDFKIGMDYIFVGEGENNLSGKDAFVFPTVGITIPLYRKKYKAMVQEVAFLETANFQARESKLNKLETLFDNTWKEYLDAERRIGLNERQLDLAKKSLKILESEYATANTNFEEILRMERKVLKYNLELEKAIVDKQATIAFINYLMGK
ncbi:MAG: TolC family protein [Bacteroidales bacterium]|jgi:outer membrane protein TolC|nr:TolC family protein [Bacteroidales bacterium]